VDYEEEIMPGRPFLNERVQNYLCMIASGTEIRASDVAKKFNMSNPSRASKEIGLQSGVKKIKRGVFVKV
jgi:hypothetical protein